MNETQIIEEIDKAWAYLRTGRVSKGVEVIGQLRAKLKGRPVPVKDRKKS